MMKKGEQGGGWRRLDNTAKLFPVITNQDLSNVFRISATLQEEIVPERLQQALEEVLPGFPAFAVKLRRGFFWYYFEWNRRKPYVEKEASYPCKYIDPHSNQLFLFRVSYYQKRINLEVFHAVTDGMGAITFLKALVCRYLQLLELKGAGQVSRELSEGRTRSQTLVEDSYLKHYKNIKQKKYSGQKAFRLNGKRLPLDGENIVHGYLDLGELKALCKAKGVSITKYLAAGLICSIYQVYWKPGEIKPITISIPVNLRAFFKSETLANFFAVTRVSFVPRDEKAGFDEILEAVSRQMDENISKEKMEETISYNVSSEKKWYVRIIPLVFKWAALNLLFRMKDGTYTMTLSNIGPVRAADETEELLLKQVERFHLILGVSKRQPVKCGVCADGDKVTVSFTSVFQDTALADAFFEHVRNDGISVDTESNGVAQMFDSGEMKHEDRGMYPEILFAIDKWRRLRSVFYILMLTVAAILGVVNYAVFSGSWWSVIAIGCIVYAMVTVRYSIIRHSNLGSKIVIQTLAAQILLAVIDCASGYQGWSVNYGVPVTILFADMAIVFLILVNRLNWQSYFMYQIAITIFSFIPLVLRAVGLITRPLMSTVTVIVSVMILTLIILLGDRSVKRELIRRFHI